MSHLYPPGVSPDDPRAPWNRPDAEMTECPVCLGTGEFETEECYECGGTGEVLDDGLLKINEDDWRKDR